MMDYAFIIQIALGGILLGGIYGLLSLGMSLNLGLLGVMNLAHGSFLILGALTGYGLSAAFGLSPLWSILLVPVLFGGLGRGLGSLWRPSWYKREPAEAFVSFLLITLGLAFVLEEASASILVHPLIGLSAGLLSWHWKGLVFSPLALILCSVLFAVFLFLIFFLFRTDLGRSLRAVPQDPEGALFVGIPMQSTRAWAGSLSLAAAGLAGVFWILLFPITPFMGLKITIMSILMVMVVGPGHILRSIVAGFSWGILESLGIALWEAQWGILLPVMTYLSLVFIFPEGLKRSQ